MSVEPDRPAELSGKLTEMLTSDRFAVAAKRFASRYSDYNANRQLDAVTDRLEELADEAGDQGEVDAEVVRPTSRDAIRTVASPLGRQATQPTLILGIGTGRCGTRSLASLLNQQPSTAVSHELRPLLPWDSGSADAGIKSRFERLFDGYPQVQRIGDVAQFYLPYVEQILQLFPTARILCLQRNRQETIDSYLSWIVQTRQSRPVNHWSRDREGFDADEWDASFPKYRTRDMAEAIGQYWNEYYESAAELVCRFPSNIRIFPTTSLGESDGIRELLDWASVPQPQHVLVKIHTNSTSSLLDSPFS